MKLIPQREQDFEQRLAALKAKLQRVWPEGKITCLETPKVSFEYVILAVERPAGPDLGASLRCEGQTWQEGLNRLERAISLLEDPDETG